LPEERKKYSASVHAGVGAGLLAVVVYSVVILVVRTGLLIAFPGLALWLVRLLS
jgi:hypothetical protein